MAIEIVSFPIKNGDFYQRVPSDSQSLLGNSPLMDFPQL